MNVSVTAKPKASSRTKNRVREHGPVFTQETEPKSVQFAGGLWIRFTAPDGWMGWLPVEEIEVR